MARLVEPAVVGNAHPIIVHTQLETVAAWGQADVHALRVRVFECIGPAVETLPMLADAWIRMALEVRRKSMRRWRRPPAQSW